MKKILLRLLITVLILFCLLIAGLYIIFSSPYFIKSYLFPAITSATGVRISTDKVYLSHFSTEIKLTNYSIFFNENIVMEGESASFKYDFWELLKGKIKISNLVINKTRVDLKNEVSSVRGKNAHKVNKSGNKTISKKNSSGGYEVNIKNIAINDSELKYRYITSNSKKSANIHLNNIDILISELGTSSNSDIKFSFSLGIKNQEYYEINADKVEGNMSFTTENWDFSDIELKAEFDGISGHNRTEVFENKDLYLDLMINDIGDRCTVDKLILNDSLNDNQTVMNIDLKGEFSLTPFRALAQISKLNITSNILNIIGCFWELDFGRSSIDYKGSFGYTDSDIKFNGSLELNNFNFVKSHLSCLGNHILNLKVLGNFGYDYVTGSYNTDKLELVVDENSKKILNLDINNPVVLELVESAPVFKNSEAADINFKIRDFDLSILENILCRYFQVQLLKGTLNSDLNLIAQNENELLLKGDIELSDGGAVYNKLRFDKIDLKQNLNLNIRSFNELSINSSETELMVNSRETLKFRTEGTVDLSRKNGNLKINFDKIDGGGVNNLPGSPGKMLAIKDVDINGFIDYAYSRGGDNFSIKSKLKGEGLEFFLKKNSPFIPLLSGNMEIDISKNNNELNFKKYICNLYMPDRRLGNLAANGTVFLYGTGKSKLNLYSEGIRLKKLITFFNSLAGSFDIDFDDMMFDTKLVLENIEYGPYLIFDCESEIKIDNGIINADPILIILNRKPIMGKIVYNFKAKDDNYFNFAVNASNIRMKPILKTYDPLAYSNSKGIINSFVMNVEGKGFSRKNLKNNLKGDLSILCRDISLPDNPENNNYIKLLFIPIEVLSQMNELFGNVNLPAFLNNFIKYSQDIFTQMINLDLKYGVICAKAENGKIVLKHIVFKGDGNPISWLKFNGELGLDETVDVTSKMKLNNYLVVPLHISGTLKKPKPNMMNLYKFVEKSAVDTIEDDFMYLVELPETIFEKLCYESDILFQSIAP